MNWTNERLIERIGGLSGLAAGLVLLGYFLWSAFVVPPFDSGREFLEFAAARPRVAFFDDWLFLAWFVLMLGLLGGVYRRLAVRAPDAAALASGLGSLGLLIAIMRSVFNIGRLQVLAAHFGLASEGERDLLVRMLAWTEQGDVARNLAIFLVGAWMTWVGFLGRRGSTLARGVSSFGIVAGLSVLPALFGYLLDVPFLTRPDGYLAVVFVLWAVWTSAAGFSLLRPMGSNRNGAGPTRG
ncbi:MAG: hypothetical protein HY534_08080 [Chloroflexi bacterium]|nr:hypothetical protein [Chloroflexota bacterium]